MTRYRTIVADPPWNVKAGPLVGGYDPEGWVNHEQRGSRDLAYPSMTLAEIAAVPVASMAEDAAHLYLWTINRYLEDSYDISRAWGFKPSTMLVWAKTPFGGGLGGTFGLCTEYILFCRRGTLASTDRIGRNWFDWKRAYDARGKPAHSRKPEAFLDLVEQVSPGPYLEMFARRNRLGWDTYGNESLEHVDLSEGGAA